jgi:DNA-binding response OmpR family regulator
MLIVEGCDSGRDAVRIILAQMGFEVVALGTLAEGLAALESPPHGILLDLVLPDGPGELLLERAWSAGLAHRVIVCTAATDPSRLNVLRSLEPAAVLSKPVALADLVAVCRALPSQAEPNDIASGPDSLSLPTTTVWLESA